MKIKAPPIKILNRARQTARGTSRRFSVALRQWPTPLRSYRILHSFNKTLTTMKLYILYYHEIKNSNFADNWICCDQTDSTWSAPAVGEIFHKTYLRLRDIFKFVEELMVKIGVIGFPFPVAALRGDRPSKEVS